MTLIRRNLSSTTWLFITNFRSKDSWQASVDFKAADDVLVNMAVMASYLVSKLMRFLQFGQNGRRLFLRSITTLTRRHQSNSAFEPHRQDSYT